MKKCKELYQKRLFAIVGIIGAIALALFISNVADMVSAFGSVTLAAGVVLAGVNYSGKSLVELKEFRGEVYQEYIDLKTLCETEKRDLNDTEIVKRDELRKALDRIDKEIEIKIQEERMAKQYAQKQFKKDNEDPEKRELKQYSLFKALAAKAEGRELTGFELEMHQEAVNEARDAKVNVGGMGIPSKIIGLFAEKRALTATGTTSVAGDQGGMLIPTDKEGLVMALRPMLVLAGLGAKTYGGMVGNLDIVKGASTTAGWETENGDADETSIATSKITVSPKRLAAFTKISKQLLLQSSQNLESDALNDILAAIAQAVEAAAINGSGSGNNQPTGLLGTSGIGSVVGGTNGLAPAWTHITDLESKIEIANAWGPNLAYLTNPKVKNKLKNIKVDAGSGLYVWPQTTNELNGYKAAISNLVPSTLDKGTSTGVCSALIFGDFSGLEIYNWGGLDVTVDPYTLAGKAQIQLTVNSFWDVAVRRPEMFAAMLDALTA